MKEDSKIDNSDLINYIGFNYDSSYFCLGTDTGFRVYQTNPYNLLISKTFNGGIGIVKILDKTNLFCLVGGGKNPCFSPNVLIIWNDLKDEITNEYRCNCFIINCYLKQKCIFIICSDDILIINTKTMELFEKINTINNPKGIFSVCNDPKKYILSFPNNKGNILIKIFNELNEINKSKEQKKEKNKGKTEKITTKIIKNAHKGNINNLCINYLGNKIASTSNRGTIIRIFNIENGTTIAELRRGNTEAIIFSLSFSINDNYLGLTSDHCTCHIFDLNNLKPKPEDSNKSFVMSYISGVGKYLKDKSIYSWRKFDIPGKDRSIVSFTRDESFKCFIIDKNGNYVCADFNKEDVKVTKEKTK
jgi:WD40 repeat protein